VLYHRNSVLTIFKYSQTCIKRSPFSCLVIVNFIWIEPLLRSHLSWKTTLSLSQRWPLNTGLTVPRWHWFWLTY
jgi:hypothetical protein